LVHLCQALKAKFYVRIAKTKLMLSKMFIGLILDVVQVIKIKFFCVFKSMSSMMADISAEFTAKLH